MKLKILTYPNSKLRQKSKPIKQFNGQLRVLAEELLKVMNNSLGVGISAVQVGKPIQLMIIGTPIEERGPRTTVMVNPVVNEARGKQLSDEGCLSLPGTFVRIERPLVIDVTYYDLKGVKHRKIIKEFAAAVVAHELDHCLNGKLMIDYLEKESDKVSVLGETNEASDVQTTI